jgi:hypothetical protein
LVLTKSLNKDFGDEGAAREILNILMRLVSRRIEGNAFFPTFVTFLKQIEAPDPCADNPKADDHVLFNKIMFYHPKPSEKIFTGDLFKIPSSHISPSPRNNKYESFGIVLTPSCDIVQGKTDKMLICYAFPIKEEYFDDSEYPVRARESWSTE